MHALHDASIGYDDGCRDAMKSSEKDRSLFAAKVQTAREMKERANESPFCDENVPVCKPTKTTHHHVRTL